MKRKYAWMIYERWANARISIENARFGTEDNYVDTVGKNTKQITEHIQNQLKEDQAAERLELEIEDPFTCKKK